MSALVLLAVAAVIAGGLLLEIEVPRGGRVALGLAAIVALTEIAPTPGFYAAGVGLGLIGALPFIARRRGRLWTAAVEFGRVGVASGLALAVHQLAMVTLPDHQQTDTAMVLRIIAAGIVFLAVLFVTEETAAPMRSLFRHILPLDVSVVCAAALLDLAYRRSPSLVLVAVVPLALTQLSFQRKARARRIYSQTIDALSLLPEVAGLTPLGESARTAAYARLIVDALALDTDAANRITTAAQLQHIGYISLHEPAERDRPIDPIALGRVGAEILRETGFLTDVADVVARAAGRYAADDLDASIVRVAQSFEALTGEDGTSELGDPFVALLSRHSNGADRTAAIALLRVHDRQPERFDEARAAGEAFRAAISSSVENAESDAHNHPHAHAAGERC